MAFTKYGALYRFKRFAATLHWAPISAIFPTSFGHFMSRHIVVILAIFKAFSLLYLLW